MANDEIGEKETEEDALGNGSRQSPLDLTQTLLAGVEPVVKPKEKPIWDKFRQFVSRSVFGFKSKIHFSFIQFYKFLLNLSRFNRTYGSQREVQKRFRTYQSNVKLAKKLQDSEQATAEYGETQFMDMSMSEFQQVQQNTGIIGCLSEILSL
jgi:hypothetical protein